MTINLSMPTQPPELRPKIIVFGVGGAGCNAVNNMIKANIEGVECVVANTDAQALAQSSCQRQVQLGTNITQGLGAGSRPEIGRAAAEEGLEELVSQLQGGHMVFITAGMGGGTGTGAAPVIARTAREHGILTVGVVTKPFHFEGAHRMKIAEAGLQELQDVVDTLIVIPNQNLFRIANEKTTFSDAFKMADEVLHSGVRGITDLMVMPGLINLDFADIRTVMSEMGKAMMGAGEADGDNRAIDAAEAAISNPLLDDVSMAGARGLLINISGGADLTLYEVDEAANRIRDEVDPGANIIFGSTFDEGLDGRMRVSVFATGIDQEAVRRPADTEVRIMKPVKPQLLESDPLEDLAREEPEADVGPAPVAPEPDPVHEATGEEEPGHAEPGHGQPAGGDLPHRAEAGGEDEAEPAAAARPDTSQSDMFERSRSTAASTAASAGPSGGPGRPADRPSGAGREPSMAPSPRPEPAPAAEAPEPNRRSLALKVIPREEDEPAPDPARSSDASGSGAHRKEAVLGFFRSLTKSGGVQANDSEAPERRPAAQGRFEADPVHYINPQEERTRPAPVQSADRGQAADKPQGKAPQRPLPQEATRQTTTSAPERDEDDLLEIPAFLRRQAN